MLLLSERKERGKKRSRRSRRRDSGGDDFRESEIAVRFVYGSHEGVPSFLGHSDCGCQDMRDWPRSSYRTT